MKRSDVDSKAKVLFHRRSGFEMQNETIPWDSADNLSKLRKRIRDKSWASEALRKNFLTVEKRSQLSRAAFNERRPSHNARYNEHLLDKNKTGRGQRDYIKMNVPKKWLREYEKKQADLRKQTKEKLQPVDRFRHAVRLVQTLNTSFRSIVHYAVKKGRFEQVTSDDTLSLKNAATQGAVENLMFDPNNYKCHHEFLMPEWAKEITLKEPQQRTRPDIHSIMQLMKQLKGFRRYSFKIQEAICGALKYDCFGRRRVVIRKGHVAQRFYFVFSGSVCVTVDDDEHIALVKPTTLLRRGDHFGEDTFIRGLKRTATVVCLERTELLSVERDDFFSAKIDVSFKADMRRRVELLKELHVFSTWPTEVVKQVSEESILQDYISDEVIIRDSSEMQWIVFVTKGQCNVLRLLDLSNCKEYVDHALKYRVEKIKENGSTNYNPDVDDISLSSVVLRGLPPRDESPEENSPAASTEIRIREKVKSAPPYSNPGLQQSVMTVSQPVTNGILHPESAEGKSPKHRVSFQDEHRELLGVEKELLQPSEYPPRSPKPSGMLHQMNGLEQGFREKHAEGENVGVGVYMMVDRLKPGQCFGAWSFLELEDQCLPAAERASSLSQQNERDLNSHMKISIKRQTEEDKPRDRRFTLVSAGCEVLKVAKEVFFKYSDAETLNKLKRLTTTYPKDSFLCQTYLKQSDWRTYRENVVDNVVVRHIARLESAKGSARSHKVRSSQVPSPLGSVKMWPSVNSRWEYFPDAGWASVQLTRPAVAGTSRPHSSNYSAFNSLSRCQSLSSRKQSPHARPHGSPVPLPSPTSKSSEKLLPLVENDLVLAQGSQRTLVLTHGGSRSNNYQLQIERRIIDKHESRKNTPRLNRVKWH